MHETYIEISSFYHRMLDEHFEDQLNDIIKLCPKSRQTMLFSATMTDQVCVHVRLCVHVHIHVMLNRHVQVMFYTNVFRLRNWLV